MGGKHNSIIGEVQFLLRAMKEYKDKAHNLYAIQRKEETVRTSVSPTLPILMDLQKEIVGIACSGDVKKMSSLMVLQNQSIKDVMFVDPTSYTNIFHKVCTLGHLKLLLFLESMLDKNAFINFMFDGDKEDEEAPIEYAVKYSHSLIVKHCFDKKEVRDRYQNNDRMIFRVLIYLFSFNSNSHITEYVLSALKISKEKVIQMLSYKCPRSRGMGHTKKVLTAVIWTGTFGHLERMIDFIGKQAFIDNVFNQDKYGYDVMKWAFFKEKLNVIEYVLSIDENKEKYMTDKEALHFLCGAMNQYIKFKECVKCVVDTLGLTEAKLNELNQYRGINIQKILPFTK